MKVQAKKVLDYYNGLPPWGKGVVVVAGAVVLYAVGKKVMRFVFPSATILRNQQLAKNVQSEVEKYRREMTPTYSDSQYMTFANTIYNGMAYCADDDYGMVEETLKKMRNNLDVALLIQAYGFRQRYCFGIPIESAQDLFTSVNAELGEEWFGITNYRVDNINNQWARTGITYRL